MHVEGHEVLVMNVSGGKGYCPTKLVEAGQMNEAARIAALAWQQKL